MTESSGRHWDPQVGDRVRVMSAEQDGEIMEILTRDDGPPRYVVALYPVATGGSEGMFNRGDTRVTVTRDNLEPLGER
ncbi:MAG: hypothetical protein M3O34_06920 [Chloroflexota bacterium]|nr:hypothetical protein [Chloroflexota bacterium]